jgi:hypothetical protein
MDAKVDVHARSSLPPVLIRQWLHRLKLPDIRRTIRRPTRQIAVSFTARVRLAVSLTVVRGFSVLCRPSHCRLAPRLELLVYPGFHAAPFGLPIVSA